jgi:hypothetical protein
MRTITASVKLKKNAGRESQEAGCQDELIGAKPPVAKYPSLSLSLLLTTIYFLSFSMCCFTFT